MEEYKLWVEMARAGVSFVRFIVVETNLRENCISSYKKLIVKYWLWYPFFSEILCKLWLSGFK